MGRLSHTVWHGKRKRNSIHPTPNHIQFLFTHFQGLLCIQVNPSRAASPLPHPHLTPTSPTQLWNFHHYALFCSALSHPAPPTPGLPEFKDSSWVSSLAPHSLLQEAPLLLPNLSLGTSSEVQAMCQWLPLSFLALHKDLSSLLPSAFLNAKCAVYTFLRPSPQPCSKHKPAISM